MSYANIPHLRSNASSAAMDALPAAALSAGAGTTGVTVSNTGTDERGQVVIHTGSSSVATGAQVVLTFASPYGNLAPEAVIVSPNDAATALLNPYASATATALTIGVGTIPTASTTYTYNYVVVGGA